MNPDLNTGGRTRILALTVLAGFAVMIAAFIPSPLRVLTYFESVPVPEIKPPPPLKMALLPAKETFAEITARPIFNHARKPDPASAPVDFTANAEQTADLAQFRVVGIVTDRETQLALVQTADGSTTKIRAGDMLAGWRIEKIDVSGVTATDGIRSGRLVIPRAENAATSP